MRLGETLDAARRRLWLGRIDRMRILDREYFEALTGRRFASDRAAIRYFLANEQDAALGLSLNPLVEREWMSHQQPAMTASWYATLRNAPGLYSTSPFFDAAVYGASQPTIAHTLGALQHFLDTVQPTTKLPSTSSDSAVAPSWLEFRAHALADARLFARQLHLRRARTADAWDASAERQFLRSMRNTAASTTQTVDIIMPTRDRLELLGAAIRSVQAQTHPNWRLVVVDDGSLDGTPEYLREMAAADDRVVPVFQTAAGVSAARNRGLAHAAGEYVAFLDSDNTWRPDFLDYSLRGMRMLGAHAVHSGVALRADDGAVRYRGIEGSREDLLYAGNFIDLNSVVLARSLVVEAGGFDETIKRWVDYDLFLAISALEVPTYLPFLGVDYDDRGSATRITSAESAGWEDVVLGKHLIDWTELLGAASLRSADLVSIIIPTYTDCWMTATAVRAVLDNSGSRPIEVIVIDNASRRHVHAILRGLFLGEPRVRIERMPRNLNFALANNYALSLSHGQYVVALNNDTEVTPGWLEPLVAALADASVLGTQPLLVYPDGTVQTAGTVFPAGAALPRHFLAGQSVSTAQTVTNVNYSAVTAAALCMRAVDLIALHGFDPLYTNGLEDVDLCLRALRLRPGAFRVVTSSVVVHFESQTPGRARAVTRNRELFTARWGDSLPTHDDWRYAAIGLEPISPE